jgi:hypothetical protein
MRACWYKPRVGFSIRLSAGAGFVEGTPNRAPIAEGKGVLPGEALTGPIVWRRRTPEPLPASESHS